MKLSINTALGIGGVLSMIISPVIAFSGVKTDVALVNQRVDALEKIANEVSADHDLLIQIGSKLNVDMNKAISTNR